MFTLYHIYKYFNLQYYFFLLTVQVLGNVNHGDVQGLWQSYVHTHAVSYVVISPDKNHTKPSIYIIQQMSTYDSKVVYFTVHQVLRENILNKLKW